MNEQVRTSANSRTTQAAEGLPRWRWTTAQLIRLTELGAFSPEDRIELVGGEIVPMSPVGRRHEVVATEIEDYLRSKARSDVRIRTERQLNLSDDTYAKPDIFVHPADIRTPDVRGPDVILVIEVADSSLGYDVGRKARLYAAHGVQEYWVVNAETLATTVHAAPAADATGYASVRIVAAGNELTPSMTPDLTIRLADLRLD